MFASVEKPGTKESLLGTRGLAGGFTKLQPQLLPWRYLILEHTFQEQMDVCWFRDIFPAHGRCKATCTWTPGAPLPLPNMSLKNPRASSSGEALDFIQMLLGTSRSVTLTVSLGWLWEHVISAERLCLAFGHAHCLSDQFLQVYGHLCNGWTHRRNQCFWALVSLSWRHGVLCLTGSHSAWGCSQEVTGGCGEGSGQESGNSCPGWREGKLRSPLAPPSARSGEFMVEGWNASPSPCQTHPPELFHADHLCLLKQETTCPSDCVC